MKSLEDCTYKENILHLFVLVYSSLGIYFYTLFKAEYQISLWSRADPVWLALCFQDSKNVVVGTAWAASRNIKLSYLLLHCMYRPRLQEAGGETHSPVVHQLQSSTTASNDVIQLKNKQNPIMTQLEVKIFPAELLHKKTSIRSICKPSFQNREHGRNSWSARSPCTTLLGQLCVGSSGLGSSRGCTTRDTLYTVSFQDCICDRTPYQTNKHGLK